MRDRITVAVLMTAAIAGCAGTGRPPALAVQPAAAMTEEVLTEDEMTRETDAVPEGEARQIAAASFPGRTTECSGDPADAREEAWVRSSIHGSFTGPGVAETMYSVQLSECDDLPSAPKQGVLLVYLGGREVWRTVAPEAVRALDVDGDGQDEWLEVWQEAAGQCGVECPAEAWVQKYRRGRAVTIAHGTNLR